jgi:hypothetical protein
MVDVNTTKQNPYASLQNDVIYNEVSWQYLTGT